MNTSRDRARCTFTVLFDLLLTARIRIPVSTVLLGLLQVQMATAQPATAIASPSVIDASRRAELTLAQPDTQVIKSRLKLSASALAGRTIRVKNDTGTVTMTAANMDAVIKPHSLLFERTGSRVQAATLGTMASWQLPVQFSYIRGDGTSFSFSPFVRVMQPLTFNHALKTFTGLLGLGVMDESRPRARERLAEPVSFTLAGAVDAITPKQVTVTHLSQPFMEVELRLRNPAEEVALDVIATLENEPDAVMVPAIRPQLKLRISPSQSIEGLGLSTAVVHVSAEDGDIFAGEQIALESTLGRLEDARVTLDAAGTAQTRIRSSFIGPARVTAQAYPFAETSDSVQFAWPVVFSIVALIGAGLGAWVRKKQGKGGFGVAVIFGVVGALLGGIGVNFLKLPVDIPAGEVFVFILTFFAAYLGPAAFKSFLPVLDNPAS